MTLRLVRLLALLLLGVGAAAQGAVDVRFRVPNLPLPHPEVQALAQGTDGLLWIGTADGVSRYDGLSLTTLRAASGDTTSLPSSNVQALLVSRGGRLWVGTTRGLASLDVRTDRFQRWTPPERGECAGGVVWLTEDASGRLLYGSPEAGVCRLDPRTSRTEAVALPWARGEGGARVLFGLPDGVAWVLGRSASGPVACLIAADGGPCRAVETGGFQPSVLGLGTEGHLLAYGTEDGARQVRQWDGDRFVERVGDLPTFGLDRSPALVTVGREVWVGTATDGVLAVDLDRRAWRWLAPVPGDPSSLPAHRVRALLVDRQGGVWVGTARGLARWRPPVRPFTVYRRYTGRPGEISDDRVNGMSETRDGSLWVTTNDGLNRLDVATGRFEAVRVPESQQAGPPAWAPATADPYRNAWWQVLEGSDATLWVGGKRHGLFRVDRRTGLFRREVEANRALRLIGVDDVPQGFGVRHLYEDGTGHLWVGTTGEGLAVRHPDGDWDAVLPGTADLPHPNVNRFYEAEDGQIWVGTDAGLARLEHEEGTEIELDPVSLGLAEETPVWAIAESPATPGELWVGTVGAGLVRLDVESGMATRYTTDEGMPSDLVYGVLADDEGRLWASTSRGLARLAPESDRVTVYDEDHGLHDTAFDLMAFYRSPTTGEMWFGGPNGLSRIDPGGAAVSPFRPPVAFTGVRVFDDRRPGRPLDGDTLTFDHDENFLSVRFAALDFTDPRDLLYRYRLVGVDEGWRETTGDRPEATYTALEPGLYRLEVLGSNVDGVFNDTPAVLTLRIEPAWWQRRPVKALGVLLMGGLLGVGVLTLVRRARDESAERQRGIADDLHAGPVQGIGRIGEGLDRLGDGGAEAVREIRTRVGDVETGLHEALLRLQPGAVSRLGLVRSLDATVRRFRRAAPHVALRTCWTDPEADLAPDAQRALVEATTIVLGHVLRVTDAEAVDVDLVPDGDGARVRVTSDGGVPVTAPALRDRLRGRGSALRRAEAVVRTVGGSLRVVAAERSVDVRVPAA